MKNAKTDTAAKNTTSRQQTAAEIIGTSAESFANDFGRAPLPGETCEEYIKYLRNWNQQQERAANGIPLANVIEALEHAAETPDSAAAIAEADAEAHRMLYPEEYADDDRPLYSGREVHELCRQAEIDTAAATAFDIVRLFIRESCNVKAGLTLFAIAAKFIPSQPQEV